MQNLSTVDHRHSCLLTILNHQFSQLFVYILDDHIQTFCFCTGWLCKIHHRNFSFLINVYNNNNNNNVNEKNSPEGILCSSSCF